MNKNTCECKTDAKKAEQCKCSHMTKDNKIIDCFCAWHCEVCFDRN